MRNYAGSRLAPWLSHLMVSRSETARPLLTPGEIMQLPPADEIVMVSGVHPIRAKKARYYEDQRFAERILSAPVLNWVGVPTKPDDWSGLPLPPKVTIVESDKETKPGAGRKMTKVNVEADPANAGIRREPELPEQEEVVSTSTAPTPEFAFDEEPGDDDAARANVLRRQMTGLARQASLDPADDLGL